MSKKKVVYRSRRITVDPPPNPFFIDEEYEKYVEDLFRDGAVDSILLSSPKCECGSDAVYGKKNKFHSNYCPKYNPG